MGFMLQGTVKKFLCLTVNVTSLMVLTGCSVLSARSSSGGQWLESGSLALSRPIPAPKSGSTALPSTSHTVEPTDNAASIIISRRDRTITAMRTGTSPLVLKTDGAQHLREGSFSVMQKEESPLWYAPKEYFTSRALPIPPEGSRQRFKRAALGAKAIYLNDQTPIHSGPIWLKEIGGVRVNPAAMAELYSMINVGTRVDIR